jgi:alpha-glucoside transport system substrate-binding protein
MKRMTIPSVLVLLALLLAACGGGAAPAAPAATTAPAATEAPAATTAPAATEAPAATTAPAAAAVVTTTAAMTPTAAMTTTTAALGPIDCMGAKSGDTVSMLYQWSGTEETNLLAILKPLADACGITLKPESTRDQALLDTRVKAGTPPDVAFWQVTTVKQYSNILKPLDTLGAHRENYPASLIEQGSVNGKWYGLTVKSDIKTIIWYSPANFKALGYTVPTTWDQLNSLVEKMVADGNVPWSMGFESGGSTGWTGADFIEDILLVQKGPQYVLDLISGKQSYNDPAVKAAWQTYGKWATDPKYTVGGAKGTLSTDFNDAITAVFADPPKALMVRQSGFAGGTIAAKYPTLKYGTDYDFFLVPGAQGMQAGSDWMMAFSDKPAVKALVAYLTSPTGAAQWAKVGFDLTPNLKGAGNYTDPLLTKKAQLLNSAQAVVPSLGDVIPDGFSNTLWTGIINYVNGGDLDQQLSTIAASQASELK